MNRQYGQQRIDEIRRIVHHEEPIHEDLVLRRACELNDVASVKSNVRANFGAAFATALKRGYIRRDQHGFLRATDQPITSFRVARNGQKSRDIFHISPAEISMAVLHVVESQFGLERKDLVTETAHTLGYGKTSVEISGRISSTIDDLIEAGELRVAGFQITLA